MDSYHTMGGINLNVFHVLSGCALLLLILNISSSGNWRYFIWSISFRKIWKKKRKKTSIRNQFSNNILNQFNRHSPFPCSISLMNRQESNYLGSPPVPALQQLHQLLRWKPCLTPLALTTELVLNFANYRWISNIHSIVFYCLGCLPLQSYLTIYCRLLPMTDTNRNWLLVVQPSMTRC